MLEDEEDDEDEEGDAAAGVAPTLVKRKIDSIVWQKRKGNSYVARACDLTQDGKMDRTKLTDYKLEATLMDLISAGTTAGFNQGVNFINAVGMDVAKVAAVAPPAAPTVAPAGLAPPALAGATEEDDPAFEADTLAVRRATAKYIPVGAGGGPWQAEPQQDRTLKKTCFLTCFFGFEKNTCFVFYSPAYNPHVDYGIPHCSPRRSHGLIAHHHKHRPCFFCLNPHIRACCTV